VILSKKPNINKTALTVLPISTQSLKVTAIDWNEVKIPGLISNDFNSVGMTPSVTRYGSAGKTKER